MNVFGDAESFEIPGVAVVPVTDALAQIILGRRKACISSMKDTGFRSMNFFDCSPH